MTHATLLDEMLINIDMKEAEGFTHKEKQNPREILKEGKMTKGFLFKGNVTVYPKFSLA